MNSIRRRIETLEKSGFANRDAEVRDTIMKQALDRLSFEELGVLADIHRDHGDQQGAFEYTEAEIAVLTTYNMALEFECRDAGLASAADLPPAPQPVD